MAELKLRYSSGWPGRILLILVGSAVMLAERPITRFALIEELEHEMYTFEARGVVYQCRAARSRFESAYDLIILTSSGFGLTPQENEEGGSLYDVPLAIGPDILKPGARFEKKRHTNRCLVDGKEYDLYVPAPPTLSGMFRESIRQGW